VTIVIIVTIAFANSGLIIIFDVFNIGDGWRRLAVNVTQLDVSLVSIRGAFFSIDLGAARPQL
jgi:hypothetical protein